MTASRTDLESGALHKQSRCSKLTLLMALQILLITGCLLAVGYIYWTDKDKDPSEDAYINFYPISDIAGGKNLTFTEPLHQNNMGLTSDKYGSRISIDCTGPYILYMNMCYISFDRVSSGSLELLVVGNEEPLESFKLNAMNTTDEFCRRLNRVVYLREKEEAWLHLNSTRQFKIKSVVIGFSYLGSTCDF